MSFAKGIEKWADDAQEDARKVMMGTAISIYSAVIKKSPVDAGQFRNSWRISAGSIDDSVEPDGPYDEARKKGTVVQANAKANASMVNGALSVGVGKSIFISNSLPYAVALEDGHSGQAPLGVAAVTVADFKRIVEVQAIKAGWKN